MPNSNKKSKNYDNSDIACLIQIRHTGQTCAEVLYKTRPLQIYENKASVILALAGWVGRLATIELQKRGEYEGNTKIDNVPVAETDTACMINKTAVMYMEGYGNGRNVMNDEWKNTGLSGPPPFPPTKEQTHTGNFDLDSFNKGTI